MGREKGREKGSEKGSEKGREKGREQLFTSEPGITELNFLNSLFNSPCVRYPFFSLSLASNNRL
jgi:flagellar biosynthesis/type III secretory pathway protein FliH